MADRPIIFSGPMVRALIEGRKTQTRRLVKGVPSQPEANCHPNHTARHLAPYLDAYCGQPRTAENPRGMGEWWNWWQVDDRACLPQFRVGYAPGDRLRVRETWGNAYAGEIAYRADGEPRAPLEWRSPIFMPRRFSRLTLTVTDVRVQRLQDISEADAVAEGVDAGETSRGIMWRAYGEDQNCWVDTARMSFIHLWDSIHGADAWSANPWVSVIHFRTERKNIDEVGDGRAD